MKVYSWGTRVAQLVKHLTVDLAWGRGLSVVESSTSSGSVLSRASASLPLPSLLPLLLLSLSLK